MDGNAHNRRNYFAQYHSHDIIAGSQHEAGSAGARRNVLHSHFCHGFLVFPPGQPPLARQLWKYEADFVDHRPQHDGHDQPQSQNRDCSGQKFRSRTHAGRLVDLGHGDGPRSSPRPHDREKIVQQHFSDGFSKKQASQTSQRRRPGQPRQHGGDIAQKRFEQHCPVDGQDASRDQHCCIKGDKISGFHQFADGLPAGFAQKIEIHQQRSPQQRQKRSASDIVFPYRQPVPQLAHHNPDNKHCPDGSHHGRGNDIQLIGRYHGEREKQKQIHWNRKQFVTPE